MVGKRFSSSVSLLFVAVVVLSRPHQMGCVQISCAFFWQCFLKIRVILVLCCGCSLQRQMVAYFNASPTHRDNEHALKPSVVLLFDWSCVKRNGNLTSIFFQVANVS